MNAYASPSPLPPPIKGGGNLGSPLLRQAQDGERSRTVSPWGKGLGVCKLISCFCIISFFHSRYIPPFASHSTNTQIV